MKIASLYILQIITIYLHIVKAQLIKNCKNENEISKKCLECNEGYILNNQLCAKCEDYLYFNNQKCETTCPNNKMKDYQTNQCQDQNICPVMIDVGQEFNDGSIINKMILINSLDNKKQNQTEIISMSKMENKTFIWDANTGQTKMHFVGHTLPIIVFEYFDKVLVTLSQNGEVIIWDYTLGSINYKTLINLSEAQLTDESQIDTETQTVTLFGFQGQFEIVNYRNQTKTTYFAHQKAVFKVILVKQQNLISYGYDGQIILWNIKDTDNHNALKTQDNICPQNLDYLIIQNESDIQSLFIVFFGNINDEVPQSQDLQFIKVENKIPIENVTQIQKNSNFKQNMNFTIIDFIIDNINQQIIVYSDKNISVLSYDIEFNTWNQTFLKQVDQLNLGNFTIQKIYLSSNLLTLTDKAGQIFVLNYQFSKSQASVIEFSKDNNLKFQLKRSIIKGVKMDEISNTLYIYGDQIACFDLKTRQIKYIITNFKQSQRKHTKQVNSIFHSVSRQLILSGGNDGIILIHNYINGNLLNALTHPQYSLETTKSGQLRVQQILIVQDSIVCSSFSNNSVVCFVPPSGKNYYIFQMDDKVRILRKDDVLKNILIFLLNSVYVYNLNDGKLVSSFTEQLAFYQNRFIGEKKWLTSYTQYGDTYVWDYPIISRLNFVSNSEYNTQKANINEQNSVTDNTINFTYYENGLLIIRYYNLTYINHRQHTAALNRCGLQAPKYIWCGANDGSLIRFNIYALTMTQKNLYNFPIIEGKFTSAIDLVFILIDYGSYGSEIQVGSVQYFLADQAFKTTSKIIDCRIDENMQRIYTAEQSGIAQAFTYIKQTNKIVLGVEENNTINKIIPLLSEYRVIILSSQISIKDYFTMSLYKSNKQHKYPVKDAIVDSQRKLIISRSKDVKFNLLYWYYEKDESQFMEGHQASVSDIILNKNSTILLSSDESGIIILWDFITLQKIKIVSFLQKNNITQMIFNTNFPNYIITLGTDKVWILNYTSDKIITMIQIPPSTKIQLDDQENRIFVINTNIKVYSSQSGIKLTELQGFDSNINQMIIYKEYIVAYALLNIVSFNRSSLKQVQNGKSTFPMYNGVIIENLFAFISKQGDSIIKLWNYETGTMLADMQNAYFPENIREIYIDESAKLLISITVQNYLFIYDPFIEAVSKIIHYLQLGNPPTTTLNKAVIDTQNNIMIVFSEVDLVFWNYYTYLGLKGQRYLLPSDPQINSIYNSTDDTIYFFDVEQNIWILKNNQLRYQKFLEYVVLFVFQKQGIIFIGESENLIAYNQDLVEQYRINIAPIEKHENKNIPYFFIICQNFTIAQIEITKKNQLNVLQYYSISNSSRITDIEFNIEFSHSLVYDIQGNLIIIDYDKRECIFNEKIHSGPIRQVKFDTQKKVLLTSSDDKKILVYNYNKAGIIFNQTITETGFVFKIILDVKNSRLFSWVHLSQSIKVMNTSNNFQQIGNILAPGNLRVNMINSEQFNLFIIYNLFQINFHSYDKLNFLFKLRSPSIINDISEVRLLSETLVLILTQSRLWTANYNKTQITLNKQYEMDYTKILYAKVENRLIILKGINQKTIFNYTMVEDYSRQYSQCISIQENPNSYFKLQRNYYLQQLSIQKSKIDIQKVENILIIENETSFYKQSEHQMSLFGIQADLKYYCVDRTINNQTQKNIIQLFNNSSDYDLESLTIENCRLRLMQNTTYTFHPQTKAFTYKNLQYLNTLAQSTTLTFKDIDILIIDNVNIEDSKFTSNNASLEESKVQLNNIPQVSILDVGPTILFKINKANIIYINQFKLRNCTLKDTVLYQISQVEKVVIKQLTLIDLYFDGQTGFYNLFDLQNIQSLTIENVFIQNTQSQKSFFIFNLQGITLTSIKNIKVQNSTNISVFNYSKKFEEEKYAKTIRNDYVLIENIILDNLTSNQPLIAIESDSLQIQNLTATNNQCYQCYGTVLNILRSSFVIESSKFINNTGFYGGAIYILDSAHNYNIISCLIFLNSANTGGGMFLDQSNLILKDSQILNNSAIIGGGIRYQGIVPDFILAKSPYKNNITLNNAKIFGKNIASYPKDILIKGIQQNSFTIKKQGDKYQVSNFRSGDYLKLLIQLVDEEENILEITEPLNSYSPQISQEIENLSLSFISSGDSQIIGQSFLTIDHFNSSLSAFELDQMIVTAEPNSTYKINVFSNQIQIPNTLSQKFNQKPYSIEIEIQFRPCIQGEIYIPKSSVQNAFCNPCPKGSYSLSDPSKDQNHMNCINCPDAALSCEGKEIKLKNGYWRENNETDILIECINNRDNCIGEDSQIQNYCKNGHIGPLCETCDSAGEVWNDVYVNIDKKSNCVRLSQINFYLVQYVIMVLGVLSYIIFAIYKTIQNGRKYLYCYYLRQLGIASFGKSEQSDAISVNIKLLMHYYYISSIIQKTLKVELPFDYFTAAVSSPIQSFQITQMSMVLMKRQSERESIFKRQIFIQAIPFILMILCFFILNVMAFFRHKPMNKSTLVNGIVFIFIFFQPDTLANVLSIMQCRTIGQKKYVAEDLIQKCYNSSHLKFLFIFTLPVFTLWSAVFPILLLTQIKKHKQELSLCQPTLRYGLLYKEYNKDQFFWEFVKMNSRIIIIVINALFYEKNLLINQLTCIVLLIYFVLISKYRPFRNNKYNKQDQISHILLIFVYLLHSIAVTEKSNQAGYYLLVIMITSINFTYIIYLFWSIIQDKLLKLVFKILSYSPKLCTFLQRYKWCQLIIQKSKYSFNFNLIPVFKNQRRLRFIIYSARKIRLKEYDNQSSPNIYQSNQSSSQNSLMVNSIQFNNPSHKYNKYLVSMSPTGHQQSREDDSITKHRSQRSELMSNQPSYKKIIKLDQLQNSLKMSDVEASEFDFNGGLNLQQQYFSENFASKSIFQSSIIQKKRKDEIN